MKNAGKKTLLIVWIIVSTLVAAIILMGFYDSSFVFWGRLLWIEFLIALVFLGQAGYILSGFSKKSDGVSMAFNLTICAYAFASFILVLIFWVLGSNESVNKWHIILQILLVIGATLAMGGLNIAKIGASDEKLDPSIKTPSEISDMLLIVESGLEDENLKKSAKKLREDVKYSLNENANLGKSTEYKIFVDEISALLGSYKTDPNLAKKLEKLSLDVKLIVNQQKRK